MWLTLRGGPVVWSWDFHVRGLKFEIPCQRKQEICLLDRGSSSLHWTYLLQVTSPMWFASYCIGAEFYLFHTQRLAVAGSLVIKKNNFVVILEIEVSLYVVWFYLAGMGMKINFVPLLSDKGINLVKRSSLPLCSLRFRGWYENEN